MSILRCSSRVFCLRVLIAIPTLELSILLGSLGVYGAYAIIELDPAVKSETAMALPILVKNAVVPVDVV